MDAGVSEPGRGRPSRRRRLVLKIDVTGDEHDDGSWRLRLQIQGRCEDAAVGDVAAEPLQSDRPSPSKAGLAGCARLAGRKPMLKRPSRIQHQGDATTAIRTHARPSGLGPSTTSTPTITTITTSRVNPQIARSTLLTRTPSLPCCRSLDSSEATRWTACARELDPRLRQ